MIAKHFSEGVAVNFLNAFDVLSEASNESTGNPEVSLLIQFLNLEFESDDKRSAFIKAVYPKFVKTYEFDYDSTDGKHHDIIELTGFDGITVNCAITSGGEE